MVSLLRETRIQAEMKNHLYMKLFENSPDLIIVILSRKFKN